MIQCVFYEVLTFFYIAAGFLIKNYGEVLKQETR